MSCEELRKVSDLGRDGILDSVSSSGDPELDELLYAATMTMKEVSKGFLVEDIDGRYPSWGNLDEPVRR